MTDTSRHEQGESMTNEPTARTPVERAAEALVAKGLADDDALEALEHDRFASDEDWEAAYDESLSTSQVTNGVVERVEGPPAILARAALDAALDVEELAAWARREFGVSNGTQTWVEFQGSAQMLATALRAYLLGTDEGGA